MKRRLNYIFLLLVLAFSGNLTSWGASLSPGTVDTSFSPSFNRWVRAVLPGEDGKILAAGAFYIVNDYALPTNLVELSYTGLLTHFFGGALFESTFNGDAYALARQADGKILVGGRFDGANAVRQPNLVRLLPGGGAFDFQFDTRGGIDRRVRRIVVQPDGKILIAGQFSVVGGVSRNRVARLNDDGSVDLTFNPGTGANGIVRALALLDDGRILIGGEFTSFNGIPQLRIARLEVGGSLDTTFLPDARGANGDIYFMAARGGRVLIAGDFTMIDGETRGRVARLRMDGTPDSTFAPPGGAVGGAVYALAEQLDGRILLGGNFTNVNGVTMNRIARLHADGSLDSSFDIGTGADGTVFSINLQPDGQILVGGAFLTFNGFSQSYLVRLHPDLFPALNASRQGNSVLLSWPLSAMGFSLESAESVTSTIWTPLTNTSVAQGWFRYATNFATGHQRFFRLAK